ncbi:MAG TPA: alpha-hydroxy-acid oxidizing protein [Candidatus Marinimicrobia bacterium]|nr:alpha-hydroxy-acid oxidizing protein [Candidatus Neomarinimicrobiota bacterium]HIO36932.1 alpha-hydroxy-acid oxidizing protein [Candidatus Neomarinimicrobiota bacterium]
MLSLSRCNNINDLRSLAKRRLPRSMFHYIDGGADDEVTLRRNTDAFDDYEIQPRFLRPVDEIDTTVTLFGKKLDIPFFIAPTGMSRLFHHTKENAVARAAAKFGTAYSLSTLGTASLEEIAKETDGPKIFQIYILKDRELTREFVERCKAANYDVLCLTVDVPLAGNRERDKVTGMTMPPRFTMKSLFSFVTHLNWTFNLLLHPDFRLANVVHRVDALGKGAMGLIEYVNGQFDRTVTWDDAARLIQQWGGPFVIKGVLTAEDAKRAREIGATALMISNHGGRQMDGVPAAIDCLAPIRDAVGSDMELILDGGIRRGTHILKALALGADAVSIGKAYLYGLAAGGQKGVELALQILKDELERDMALMGCGTIQELSTEFVKHRYDRSIR